MKITPMSFKGYVWPVNPEMIRVERMRNTAEFKIPEGNAAVQDNGSAPRKVTGSGKFTGTGCMEQFSRLSSVFAEGGSGMLLLPGSVPFYAVFAALAMTGRPRPNCIEYEFSFLEDPSYTAKETALAGPRKYVCTGGENLWEVANRYGTDVDSLRMANPQIERPYCLPEGMEVAIP